MVQHFHEHHTDIGTWLDEISNEVTSLGASYDNPEQIKKQQDSLKVSGDINALIWEGRYRLLKKKILLWLYIYINVIAQCEI